MEFKLRRETNLRIKIKKNEKKNLTNEKKEVSCPQMHGQVQTMNILSGEEYLNRKGGMLGGKSAIEPSRKCKIRGADAPLANLQHFFFNLARILLFN